jgi:RTX calcium-binding nonapeptide repeat (4 copies)
VVVVVLSRDDRGMTPRGAMLAIAATFAAFAPDTASASTVSVLVEPPDRGPWAGIVYDAASGEVNRVELFTVDDRRVRISDPGATVQPGAGCSSVGPHTAMCSTAALGGQGLIGADVRVADGDDSVNSHGPGLSADGGPGDDRIESSGPVAGTLNGGGGRDVLLGGPNHDTLIDGDTSGEADSDILDGRAGGATVSYAGRSAPVEVDLTDTETDGERGEGDVLGSIDRVIGGSGDDVLHGHGPFDGLEGGPGDDRLLGGPGPGYFKGGPGRDRISAGSGDDEMAGGPGRDVLLAGRGDDGLDGGRGSDRLHAGAGDDRLTACTAFCGPGRDRTLPSRELDYVLPDCEQAGFGIGARPNVDFAGIDVEPNPYRQHDDSIWFRGTCPYTELDGYADGLPMRGRLTLRRAGGEVLGRGRIPVAAAARCAAAEVEEPLPQFRVRVLLSRVLSTEPIRATVTYTGRNVPPVPWTIRLSAGVR